MSERSRIRHHPERSVPEETAAILRDGYVAHVGFVDDGQPVVIPLGYDVDPEDPSRLYFHGALESRALAVMGSGAPVCVSITLLDGLVYSRTALYHSMNYRSVVGFGTGRRVDDPAEKAGVLERTIRRYFPGRTEGRDYAAPPAAHLEATLLIEVQVEEWSAKARRGGPKGPRDADPDAPGTAGVTAAVPTSA